MISDTRLGGVVRYYLSPPKDWNMFIPDEVLKCVVFIGIEQTDEKNVKSCHFGGTGFLVSIPSDVNKNLGFIYLVTAHHNIAKVKKYGLDNLRISINTHDGGKDIVSLGGSADWFEHPDHDNNPADVVVIPFSLDRERHDVMTIPIEMLLTEEHIKDGKIGIGNEVFITGLFSRHYGQKKNLPIVRTGNVAMLSQEKIKTSSYGEIDAYLIEARSIGGISGSPVFFQEPNQKNGTTYVGGRPFWLGGLIHGHYPTSEDAIDNLPSDEDAKKEEEKNVNMGIAIVTPAIKIIETLNQPSLRQQRVESEKEIEMKNTKTVED